jgi:hypothetical protein
MFLISGRDRRTDTKSGELFRQRSAGWRGAMRVFSRNIDSGN